MLGNARPEFFCDEGHERMEQLQNAVEHPRRRVAGLGFFGFIIAVQYRLDEFDVPVAENVPNEVLNRPACFVKTMGSHGEGPLGAARAVSATIHLFTVVSTVDGSKSRLRTHSFISQKRAAFQS